LNEIIIQQEPVGPRRVRFPRAANNELAQNAVGPSAAAGPSSISSILKECAKSHSVCFKIFKNKQNIQK
jgi:hypothetical protein